METVHEYRGITRKAIEDMFWDCPIHGDEFNRECVECKDCLEVNIILNHVLDLHCLNVEPYGSH